MSHHLLDALRLDAFDGFKRLEGQSGLA